MKLKLVIFSILTVALFTSCSGFLDVKPAGRLIPEKDDIAAFDNLLNNSSTYRYIFSSNNSTNTLSFLGDDLQISDNQADYAWYSGHPNIECYFAQIFKKPYGNPNIQDYYWNWGFYSAAQYFNTCIEGVKKVMSEKSEDEANRVIAQATIARAWGYFIASIGYGPVYKPGLDNSVRVLPYRTSDNVLGEMEDLSTMQEIYDSVLSDIHSSLPFLPDQSNSNTRFSKVQAYTFLAYYHLFTAKYDSVALYADKALELAASQNGGMENLFYDMNEFEWADTSAINDNDVKYSSSINTSQGSDPVDATYMREICLYRTGAGAGNYSSYPSEEYKALFDSGTDLRCEYYMFEYDGFKSISVGETFDDGRQIQYYQNKIGRTAGFTYPELLLMRAEGRARTNNPAGALSDLNYLRKLRHKRGTPDLVISTADDLMVEIANERRREIHPGSYKRFADLKRYTNDLGKPWSKTSVSHTVNGVSYRAEIDSDYFILPIRNTVLQWNPQWGIALDDSPWSSSK